MKSKTSILSYVVIYIFLFHSSFYSLRVVLTHIHVPAYLQAHLTFLKKDKEYVLTGSEFCDNYFIPLGEDLPFRLIIKDLAREKWLQYYIALKKGPGFYYLSIKLDKSSDSVTKAHYKEKLERDSWYLQPFSDAEIKTYGLECYYEMTLVFEALLPHPKIQLNPYFVKALAADTFRLKNE